MVVGLAPQDASDRLIMFQVCASDDLCCNLCSK